MQEEGVNITANSVHPGLIMTPLMRHSTVIMSTLYILYKVMLGTILLSFKVNVTFINELYLYFDPMVILKVTIKKMVTNMDITVFM